MRMNPASTPFLVATTPILSRRYTTHSMFIKNSSTLTYVANPASFKKEVTWTDCMPSFLNYLQTIPGRDGYPLKYICRDHEHPNHKPNLDFIDDYVAIAPLSGGGIHYQLKRSS